MSITGKFEIKEVGKDDLPDPTQKKDIYFFYRDKLIKGEPILNPSASMVLWCSENGTIIFTDITHWIEFNCDNEVKFGENK